MNTDAWASLDQFTSFAKEPWGFNRPENRKEHNVLSKATFVEWPNTTSNFSLDRGVAPAGKLAARHKSRFVNQPGTEMVSRSLSSAASKAITTKTSSCAISDAQLRATISNTNGARPAESIAVRNTATVKPATPAASQSRATERNSADNVTAAYTLLHQAAAQRNVPSGRKDENTRRTSTTTFSVNQGATARPPNHEGHNPPPSTVSHDWSVKNIGFNDIKSETRARIERENHDGYERAAFASRDADKSYIAEATHFRFRYPHTLGRIEALSNVRSDRVVARRNRAGTSDNR